MNDIVILTILNLAVLIYAPAYFFFRKEMTKARDIDHTVTYYTKKKVWMFVFHILIVILVLFLIAFALTFSIKERSARLIFSPPELVILFVIFLMWSIVVYGVGFYISGIMVEQYTLSSLKHNPAFRIENIPTRLMHGPISHVFMYTGALGVLLSIVALEVFNLTRELTISEYLIYIIYGLIFGGAYLYSQIKNLTWRHQMPGFFAIFIIHMLLLLTHIDSIPRMPLNIFLLVAEIIVNSGLIFWWRIFKRRKLKYIY